MLEILNSISCKIKYLNGKYFTTNAHNEIHTCSLDLRFREDLEEIVEILFSITVQKKRNKI